MARTLSNLVLNDPGENGWLGSVDLSELGTNKAWAYAYGKITGQHILAGSIVGDGSEHMTVPMDLTELLCGENGQETQGIVIHARVGPTAATGVVDNGVDSIRGIPSIIERIAPYIRRR